MGYIGEQIQTPPTDLYHGTPTKNIEIILKNGLQPSQTEGLVCLSTSYNDALAYAILRAHNFDITILKINPKILVELDIILYQGGPPSEIISKQLIPPRALMVLERHKLEEGE